MDVLGFILMNVMGGWLGRMGLLSPYMGGLMALWVGVGIGLPAIGVVCGVVTVYLTVFLANGVLQSDGESTDLSMALNGTEYHDGNIANPGVIILLKVCGVLLPMILGFTGFGFFIGPFAGILLAAVFSIFILSFQSGTTPLFYLAASIQCLLLLASLWLYNSFSSSSNSLSNLNPIPGIIASISVWGLLLGEKEEDELERYARVDNTPYIPTALSAVLTLSTPGLTSGVVSGALLNPGKSRTISTVCVEALIEGVVLTRFLHGSSSGKTMLGEILQSPAINLFNLTQSFSSFLFLAPLISLLFFILSCFLPNLPFIDRKLCIAFISILMSIFTVGKFTLLFLFVGFILYIIRRSLPEDTPDSRSLSFLLPLFLS